MTIKTAEEAYAYAKTHYPTFPNDWNISAHFTWNDVFKNELKQDGLPSLDIFKTAVKSSVEFEKVRTKIGKPMNVHCWYRSMAHNLRLKAQGLKPAMHSSHLYAMALDYDVVGMTESKVRTILIDSVKRGEIHIRIEPETVGWIHNDVGNPYTKDYRWGMINM